MKLSSAAGAWRNLLFPMPIWVLCHHGHSPRRNSGISRRLSLYWRCSKRRDSHEVTHWATVVSLVSLREPVRTTSWAARPSPVKGRSSSAAAATSPTRKKGLPDTSPRAVKKAPAVRSNDRTTWLTPKHEIGCKKQGFDFVGSNHCIKQPTGRSYGRQ